MATVAPLLKTVLPTARNSRTSWSKGGAYSTPSSSRIPGVPVAAPLLTAATTGKDQALCSHAVPLR